MNKTIGLLAHVDAGKTTLAEQILYHTKSIIKRGRVDHKDSFLDNSEVEKDRGITVFSEQAIFNYKNSSYFLVDTPGHIDFSTEMERAIKVMDYAVLILSAVEGIQGQTEIIWELLRKYAVPTIFFINKVDRVGANVEKVVEDIKENFTGEVFQMKEDKLGEELIEFLAEKDDELCEMYLNSGYDEALWLNNMKKLIKKNKIFPYFVGSALQDEGIDYFIEKLDFITYTEYDANKEFGGLVYKIRHDENNNRITYIKALQGVLKVKEEVEIGSSSEKIDEIRFYNGSKFKTSAMGEAGEIFAVTGLKNASAGDGIGVLKDKTEYRMVPTLKSKVIYDENLNPKEVFNYFKLLEEEDPSLNILWEEKLHQLEINIMGKIQLEIMKAVILERFGLKVDFGPCEVLYKETITEKTMGYGHFEPLKHYAEVHLRLEPGNRGEGITFKSECSLEALTLGEQNLICTHIFEKEHRGILIGASLTDLRITLVTGRHHIKHTSGGDFREATLRALRQGLESTSNIVLEPFYRFKLEVETNLMGKVLSDIQRLMGEFNPPKILGDKCVISGRGPVSKFMDYPAEIVSFTKGKGKINFIFDGYDKCHNEAEIIKKVEYNRNADIEYSSTSIFCSKGQAYRVTGDKAKAFMHCLK